MLLISLLLSLAVISLTIAFHFVGIRGLYGLMPEDREQHSHSLRSIGILHLLFLIHLTEILLFTGALYIGHVGLGIGGFGAQFTGSFTDYFYFSTVSYTTLGMSSFKATEALRILVGLEGLAGFVMLTWSATFFYNLAGAKPKES